MNYKDYIISQGGREYGLSFDDIREDLLTPSEWKQFMEFIEHQTCGVIGGISIVYTGDYERFLRTLNK